MKLLKWQQEYIKLLESLNNDDLFEKAFDDNEPDDYDGCFTKRGQWYANVSKEFLRQKLEELQSKNDKLRAKKTFEGIEAQYKQEIKLINEIEEEIVMNTAFDGEHPYVGNAGILLALSEHFAECKKLKAENEELRRILHSNKK